MAGKMGPLDLLVVQQLTGKDKLFGNEKTCEHFFICAKLQAGSEGAPEVRDKTSTKDAPAGDKTSPQRHKATEEKMASKVSGAPKTTRFFTRF